MKRTVTTTERANRLVFLTIGVIVATYLLFAALLATGLIKV